MLLTELTALLSLLSPLLPGEILLACVLSVFLSCCTFFWSISKNLLDFKLYFLHLFFNEGLWTTHSPRNCAVPKLEVWAQPFLCPFPTSEAGGVFCHLWWEQKIPLFVCCESQNNFSSKACHEQCHPNGFAQRRVRLHIWSGCSGTSKNPNWISVLCTGGIICSCPELIS